VVGESAARKLCEQQSRRDKGSKDEGGLDCANARAFYCFLKFVVAPKVEMMNGNTLGQIVAWASPFGLHRQEFDVDCEHGVPAFINRTGLMDVFLVNGPNQDGVPEFFGGGSREVRGGAEVPWPKPRACLEALAVATIICILRDIIMQKDWQHEATYEKEGMERSERGGRRVYRDRWDYV
jgi:hypothetical protein